MPIGVRILVLEVADEAGPFNAASGRIFSALYSSQIELGVLHVECRTLFWFRKDTHHADTWLNSICGNLEKCNGNSRLHQFETNTPWDVIQHNLKALPGGQLIY